jgi:hypothetical protein
VRQEADPPASRVVWGRASSLAQATDVLPRARRDAALARSARLPQRRTQACVNSHTSLRAPERRDGAKAIFRRVSFFATRTVTNGADGRTGPDLLRSLVRLSSTLYAVPIASGTSKGPSSPSKRPAAPTPRPSSSGSPVPLPALPPAAPGRSSASPSTGWACDNGTLTARLQRQHAGAASSAFPLSLLTPLPVEARPPAAPATAHPAHQRDPQRSAQRQSCSPRHPRHVDALDCYGHSPATPSILFSPPDLPAQHCQCAARKRLCSNSQLHVQQLP